MLDILTAGELASVVDGIVVSDNIVVEDDVDDSVVADSVVEEDTVVVLSIAVDCIVVVLGRVDVVDDATRVVASVRVEDSGNADCTVVNFKVVDDDIASPTHDEGSSTNEPSRQTYFTTALASAAQLRGLYTTLPSGHTYFVAPSCETHIEADKRIIRSKIDFHMLYNL